MHRSHLRHSTPSSPPGRGHLRPVAIAVVAVALLLAGCSSGSKKSSAKDSGTSSGCRSAADAAKATQPSVKAGAKATKLSTVDLIKGCGAVIKNGDSVLLNYVGVSVTSGHVFDESYSRGQALPFVVGQHGVIPGFEQGVIGARIGGRREIRIPPALGYGSQPPPAQSPDTQIAVNDTIVFV
ncbi:MAG TPA: FKBP-type peptidyl-prolyl cis-trans isomerase, partial [Acidimicrobiales bacterium]